MNDRMEVKLAATRPPGAPVLDGFRLLTHAPGQWGPGVRTEDVGAPVDQIAEAHGTEPDHAKLAELFGTTPDHIRQAIAYRIMHAGSGE